MTAVLLYFLPKLRTFVAVAPGGLLLASVCLVSPVVRSQEVLFQDRFDDYALNAVPATAAAGGPWSTVAEGSNEGAMRIIEDNDNVFGYGTGNRFLRIEDGVGFNLNAQQAIESEVVTLSFDFVDRRTMMPSSGAERLTIQLFAGDGAVSNTRRAHIFSLQNGSEIRVGAGSYPDETRLRFDMIMNNSAAEITYETLDGTKTLGSGLADVWIDGELAAQDYSFARAPDIGPGPIRSFSFQTFSTDRFSLDLNNFTIFSGAHVMETIEAPSGEGRGTLIELSHVEDSLPNDAALLPRAARSEDLALLAAGPPGLASEYSFPITVR